MEATGKIAYADMEVQIHKTMNAAAHRFKFLDLVASGTGIFGDDWIRQWISALQCIGVDPHADEIGKTLMPALAEDGTAQRRALESDEASVWLRLILGEDMDRKNSSRQISSHSLKATLLAMAAKRGLKHEDRLAMGHHAHPFKMADTYARDAQARTIRLIDKLLLEIRSGYFDSDTTRAGRFNKNLLPDPSLDVGGQSFLESDVESMEMEKSVENTLDDAAKVVEDETVEMDENHLTSSSSESEAESVELQAPCQNVPPTNCTGGIPFHATQEDQDTPPCRLQISGRDLLWASAGPKLCDTDAVKVRFTNMPRMPKASDGLARIARSGQRAKTARVGLDVVRTTSETQFVSKLSNKKTPWSSLESLFCGIRNKRKRDKRFLTEIRLRFNLTELLISAVHSTPIPSLVWCNQLAVV